MPYYEVRLSHVDHGNYLYGFIKEPTHECLVASYRYFHGGVERITGPFDLTKRFQGGEGLGSSLGWELNFTGYNREQIDAGERAGLPAYTDVIPHEPINVLERTIEVLKDIEEFRDREPHSSEPWTYHHNGGEGIEADDYITDADGITILQHVGHLDGPVIVERVNYLAGVSFEVLKAIGEISKVGVKEMLSAYAILLIQDQKIAHLTAQLTEAGEMFEMALHDFNNGADRIADLELQLAQVRTAHDILLSACNSTLQSVEYNDPTHRFHGVTAMLKNAIENAQDPQSHTAKLEHAVRTSALVFERFLKIVDSTQWIEGFRCTEDLDAIGEDALKFVEHVAEERLLEGGK